MTQHTVPFRRTAAGLPVVALTPPAPRAGTRLLAGATFFVVATLGVAALAQKHMPIHPTNTTAPSSSFGAQLTRVVVASAEMLPPGKTLSLQAEVRPQKQVVLYAKVSGYLKEARFEKGDRVTAGQVLGVLENGDADGRISAAQAEVSFKKKTAKRAKTLSDTGAVSTAENDKAEAEVAIASAELSRAYVSKGYSVMKSPFAGTITARYADPGALLQAATSSTGSALPLAELSDVSTVRITFYVGQQDAQQVKEGAPVKIWPTPDAQAPIEAKLTRTTHALDPRTRTMQCEVDLPNQDSRFTAGSSVRIDVTATTPSTLGIPAGAVFSKNGKSYVMAIRDNKAAMTPVEVGDHDGKRVRVLSGLKEGDLVAQSSLHEIAPGTKVETVKMKLP